MIAERNILVGYEGSDADAVALDYAARLAQRNGALLTVVLVLGRNWLTHLAAFTPGGPALVKDAEEGTLRRFRSATNDLPADLSVTTLVQRGELAETLAEIANDRRCGTVVIGPHLSQRRRARIERALARGNDVDARLTVSDDGGPAAIQEGEPRPLNRPALA